MHFAPVEGQRACGVAGLENAPEAPEVNGRRVPQITGRLAEPEVLGASLDIGDHAVDVDVSDLEQDAHRLRETVLLAPLEELGASEGRDVRIAAAVDEGLAPDS